MDTLWTYTDNTQISTIIIQMSIDFPFQKMLPQKLLILTPLPKRINPVRPGVTLGSRETDTALRRSLVAMKLTVSPQKIKTVHGEGTRNDPDWLVSSFYLKL